MPESEQTSGRLTDTSHSFDPTAVQVVVGCDDGYARHLAVMLLSLFAHSTSSPLQVHVMVPPGFTSRTRLDETLGANAGRLTYHVLADQAVVGLTKREDLTAATYYRLLMGDVLPPDMQRVIYLDCDLMLRGDIAELWHFPLGDAIVAAVPDPGFTLHHVLGLSKDAPYFNAGVLLIDLMRWRSEAIGEKALAFATRHPDRLTYDDQCALNWVLDGCWATLDSVWNLQARMLGEVADGEIRYYNPLPPVAADARILHFNAPGRPWHYMNDHPFKPHYLSYKARTPWRGEQPVDRYPHNIIIKTLRRHAPVLLPVYLSIRRYV